MNQVAESVKGVKAAAAGAGGEMVPPVSEKALSSMNECKFSVGKIVAGFTAAQVAVSGFMQVLASISGSVKEIVTVNSQMEQLRLQFDVMIGNKQKMEELFAITKQFADTTPFNDLDSYRAGQQLLAANVRTAEEYKSSLRSIGDLAAASGRPINEVAAAYARLKSGATGEAMEALRLMNISRQMFQMKGIRFDAGGQALATSTEMTGALDRIIRDQFGGMSQRLSKTWEGLWSTFTSTAQNATRELTGGSFEVLKASLNGITEALDKALKDPGQSFQKMGAGITSLTQAFKDLLSAAAPFGDGGVMSRLAVLFNALGNGLSTFANTSRMAGAAMQFFWDVVSMDKNALANFKANMAEISRDVEAQAANTRKVYGMKPLAPSGVSQEDFARAEALKAAGKAMDEEHAKILVANEKTVKDIDRIMKAQESAWAVAKAKGQDEVEIARQEMELRQQNLAAIQAGEEKERQMLEAKGERYIKTTELLSAEAEAAKSMMVYYEKLIEKQDKLGGFVTATQKLQTEAAAIDKRGGDSTVKQYEAKKAAMSEYMTELKKMQDVQTATESNAAKMAAAEAAARGGGLATYQTQLSAIEQAESLSQINSIQSRLAAVQSMTQAQGVGARERFSLYEQERQLFAELTGSIGSAIAKTMSQIDALQGKAVGAASAAVGALSGLGASKGEFQQVADMIGGLNLDFSSMSLSNLSQIVSLTGQLKQNGANVSGISPKTGDIIQALRRELTGVPETITKLQSGLSSLVGAAAQLGTTAADNFFNPWMEKIETLRAALGGLGGAAGSFGWNQPAPATTPGRNDAGSGAVVFPAIPTNTPVIPSQSERSTSLTANIAAKTDINVQGSTLKDIEEIVARARDKFGDDLYQALRQANAQFGV